MNPNEYTDQEKYISYTQTFPLEVVCPRVQPKVKFFSAWYIFRRIIDLIHLLGGQLSAISYHDAWRRRMHNCVGIFYVSIYWRVHWGFEMLPTCMRHGAWCIGNYHNEAQTQWPQFCRRHFQMNCLKWRCLKCGYYFTANCSRWSNWVRWRYKSRGTVCGIQTFNVNEKSYSLYKSLFKWKHICKIMYQIITY